MAVIELEANLTAASDSKAQAGLRMCLEAVIRRPKPSLDFNDGSIRRDKRPPEPQEDREEK
jgi:hypothetical protein